MYNIYKNNKGQLRSISYEKEDEPPLRRVSNFTKDLSDGLVLICLILNYCPYLEYCFRHIYTTADTYEKAFHNAAKIVEALNIIKTSFQICPTDIVEPQSVQMILFVTYCFEVLPFMYPRATIKLEASLSKHSTETVTLKVCKSQGRTKHVFITENKWKTFVAFHMFCCNCVSGFMNSTSTSKILL